MEPSGILTITGGKWTTYRRMAEHCVDEAAKLGGLAPAASVTRDLPIHGFHPDAAAFGHLRVYGSDAPCVLDLAAPRRLASRRSRTPKPK